MHTVEELAGDDFEYRSDGEVVSRGTVLPGVTPEDRVGVVMGTGTDGLGAGAFLLSCIVGFYEHLEETKEEFFEYPNYYTFQTTAEPADYQMLDIYPEHKNVSVEPEDESILRSITDRGITVLLVPDVESTDPELMDVTRRSAERRIEDCYVYAADGTVRNPDFTISHPRDPAAAWYETTASSVDADTGSYRLPSTGQRETYVTQQFRQVSLEESLSRFPVR